MPDASIHLSLPYIQPSQAQKHVTHNEAVQVLDAVVQLAVIDRDLATPPALPAEGARYIAATGAGGAWAGWDLNVVIWLGSAWLRLTPKTGWLVWVVDEAKLLVWDGNSWEAASPGAATSFLDGAFRLENQTDPTKVARFNLADLTTGTTRVYTLPDVSTEVAGLAGAQSFSGAKTFNGTVTAANTLTATGAVNTTGTVTASGPVNTTGTLAASGPLNASGAVTASGTLTSSGAMTVSGSFAASGSFATSGATATLGSATATASYGVGTGATLTAVTKTLNLGTGGVSGSTTVVNVGSATAGAGGTLVVNSPTVTFANTVTAVAMPQANLTALYAGLGGATADATNRLSVNTPAVLLNNAGTSIEATVNKNATGNDAALAFKTGFSTRALIGLLANDDFSFKVSANGSTYNDAILIDRTTGRVDFPQPVQLKAVSVTPPAPGTGELALYARTRAGQPALEVQRPTGRDFAVQPHFGSSRMLRWLPSNGASITTEGSILTSVGTVTTIPIASTNLLTGMRRFRLTSAAVVDSVADMRSPNFICFRGNAAGLGGFNHISRISLTTLQATGMGFFGLLGSATALATTTALTALVNAIGIGFQRGTHANWQLVTNDAAGSPTLTDMGAGFAIATGGVHTLTIAAVPNAASIWVRVVNDVSGAVFEQEVTADLPVNTTLLSPRLFMNNGATAAAVAWECSGVYIETDY